MLKRSLLGGLLLCALLAASAEARRPRVVYYTGTFNPVHKGHLNVARTARNKLKADLVVLVPNPDSVTPKRPLPLPLRVSMLRAAVKHAPGIQVADAQLLRRFRDSGHAGLHAAIARRHRGAELYRVWGTDSFLGNLANGVVQQHIDADRTPVVIKRAGYALPKKLPEGVIILDELQRRGPPISSSRIRTALARGERPHGLHASVARFIQRHQLFGGQDSNQRTQAPAVRTQTLARSKHGAPQGHVASGRP